MKNESEIASTLWSNAVRIYLNPLNGRFNALDSFKGDNSDPQSLHKYAYCHGDPVNGIDPSGYNLVEQLCVLGAQAIGYAIRLYPAVRITFAVWDAITITRILYKWCNGEQVTAWEWTQFGLASFGLLLGPGSKVLGKMVVGNFLRISVGPALRTIEGAEEAIRNFCRLEEMASAVPTAGGWIRGGFDLDELGVPVIYYVKGNGLRTAKTLVHEFLHYWHWRWAGRPTGAAYQTWKTAAKAFEESTYSQFQLADGTTGFFSQVAQIIIDLAK